MTESNPVDEIESNSPSRPASQLLPFEDLDAPEPSRSSPPRWARWLGLLAVTVSGLLGGLIGYGSGELMGETQSWALGGLVVGAATAAIGVGVIVSLTLQAMNEWNATTHPEEVKKKPGQKSTTAQGLRELAAEHERKQSSPDEDASDLTKD